ncbi:hypothetical protein ACU8KH_00001 [Lachancea thermotolerans]
MLHRLYKPSSRSHSRKLFIEECTFLGIFKNIRYGRIPQDMGKTQKNLRSSPLVRWRALVRERGSGAIQARDGEEELVTGDRGR